jgi:aminoglycoside 6'-N-acetyltransferase I
MMDIVRADAAHIQEWAALSTEMFPAESREDWERQCVEFLDKGQEVGFLCRLDGCAVGYLNVSIRRDYVNGTDSSPVAFIEAVYVKPAYRNRGIARRLMAEAERFARDNGLSQIASDCLLDNTDSEQFHKSCGFAEAERVICFVKNIEI